MPIQPIALKTERIQICGACAWAWVVVHLRSPNTSLPPLINCPSRSSEIMADLLPSDCTYEWLSDALSRYALPAYDGAPKGPLQIKGLTALGMDLQAQAMANRIVSQMTDFPPLCGLVGAATQRLFALAVHDDNDIKVFSCGDVSLVLLRWTDATIKSCFACPRNYTYDVSISFARFTDSKGASIVKQSANDVFRLSPGLSGFPDNMVPRLMDNAIQIIDAKLGCKASYHEISLHNRKHMKLFLLY